MQPMDQLFGKLKAEFTALCDIFVTKFGPTKLTRPRQVRLWQQACAEFATYAPPEEVMKKLSDMGVLPADESKAQARSRGATSPHASNAPVGSLPLVPRARKSASTNNAW